MTGPVDRWHLAYLSYLVLGMGTLFPWNAFITAADYFEAQYPGRHADRLFTVCYLPVNLVVLAVVVRHHGRVRPLVRIVGGFIGFTIAVSAVPLLDLAGPADAALGVILALVALCGVCDGFAQGALFGDAAALPPKFTQALVSGTALSGVVVCLLRMATKATLPDTPEGLRASASAYFTLAALVCASCILLYAVVVPRLPVIRHYRAAAVVAALAEAAEWGATGGKGAGLAGDALEAGALKRGDISAAVPDAGDGAAQLCGSPAAAGGAGMWQGASRGASPERLTDMVEEEPAQHAQHAQHGKRSSSIDVELVPEDHYPPSRLPLSDGEDREEGYMGADPSSMRQALLNGLSDSYYSVAEEPTAPQHAQRGEAGHPQGTSGSATRAVGWWGWWGRRRGAGRASWQAAAAGEEGSGAAGVGSWDQQDHVGVLHQLWRFAAANAVIYTVTLSIFPGVLAEDVSSARLGSWYPVVLITIFNCADGAGKSAPGLEWLRLRNERVILGAAAARVLFLPAFHLAATTGSGPVAVGLLTLLLGLTNGYLTSCAMIGAPERVSASCAALAGNLMVLSLVLGLCIGAACGFLWLL